MGGTGEDDVGMEENEKRIRQYLRDEPTDSIIPNVKRAVFLLGMFCLGLCCTIYWWESIKHMCEEKYDLYTQVGYALARLENISLMRYTSKRHTFGIGVNPRDM